MTAEADDRKCAIGCGKVENMATTSTHAQQARGRFAFALIGLILTLVSPVFWALTLDVNFLQRTGLMMWVAMAIGLVCAAAAFPDRRLRTRIVAGFTCFWVLFSIPGFFIFTRLPAAPEFERLQQVADFSLPNQLNQMTSLSDMLADHWVLLVFYRGYW